MTAFAARVSSLTGVPEERLERLAGGDLSQIFAFDRPDGRRSVAKGGTAVGTEAAMLRALAAAGVPSPSVEGEHDGVRLLEYIENDGLFSPAAWRSVGKAIRSLHEQSGDTYGWPVNYALGTVELDNRTASDWPKFWAEQRLASAARVLDRPWRERVEQLARRIADLLPAKPLPSLLHGDLWSGNILAAGGALAALVDPACYYGHSEVDLAMLALFEAPPPEFWESYGLLETGWEERRRVYQLFPALVHLRLFGATYAGMVDRILESLGA